MAYCCQFAASMNQASEPTQRGSHESTQSNEVSEAQRDSPSGSPQGLENDVSSSLQEKPQAVHGPAVRMKLRVHSIAPPSQPTPLTPSVVRKVLALREYGLTLRQIATR